MYEKFFVAPLETGLSRSRAYELIGNAGGIPQKIKPQSVKETAAYHTAKSQKRRANLSGASRAPDNVIPWPKDIKKPARDSRPIGDKLTGRDREEMTGRTFVNCAARWHRRY